MSIIPKRIRVFFRASWRFDAFLRAKKAGLSDTDARTYSDMIYPPTPDDLAYEASFRPRSPIKRLFRAYLFVGVLCAVPMEISYVYAAIYLIWSAGFHAALFPAAFTMLVGTIDAFVRVIDWLPMIIVWAVTDNPYSFGMWLAPGFYIEAISASSILN